MSTYLSWLLRSLRERAQGGALSDIQTDGRRWPIVDGANSLSGVLLVFPVSQVIQPLFLRLNFPTTLFLPNLILYLQINKFFLANATSNSLDPPGLDPGRLP